MKKLLSLLILFLIPVIVFSQKNKERLERTIPAEYTLNNTNSEVLVDNFSAVHSSVEFDLLPQNSSAQAGALFRYTDKNNWVYVGCDKATDNLGFAYWYVKTPLGKTEIARDIAKLYAHHQRRIKINCIGQTVTIYVDGEQIAHKYIADLPEQSGQTGFRVHDAGNVKISNVCCKPVQKPEIALAGKKSCYTLSSPLMEVLLNKDFPSVRGYRWKKNQAELSGQPFNVKYVQVNGDRYLPTVTSKVDAGQVLYTLKIKEIGVILSACCEVVDNVFQLRVTDINEQGDFRVKTLAFPNHNLVSVSHSTPEACLSVANTVHSDSFLPLKDKTKDNTYQYGTILLLNSDKLVATLESNSVYNTRQFLYQSSQTPTSLVTGIWGNEWIYRGHDNEVVDMPYIKVIISGDSNADGLVDWQDGAMALQKVYPKPVGVEMVQNSYATITMNFASCAQYPFLRQLDNIKKFYLATDGFGQMLELKGYQGEGHDSAHPDYAGNYNQRAGGLNDFSFMVKEAKKYNAHVGVHINQSESYPEAKAFNDRIVTDMPAWSWLDQSFFINKEADMLAGSFEKRLNQLKNDVPDLSFIYIDTYREYRWLAYKTARLFNQNNWAIWTEDSDVFDKEAIWIHYQPESKSLIHRFVHHQYRDGYAEHPALLGGYSRSTGIGYMGWQKGRDFYGVIRNFFTKQLPYRYLMHFPLMKLDSVSAVLRDGVMSYQDKQTGTVIKKDNVTLMSGECVFIPWNPVTEEKIYHYTVRGGTTSWELPASWKNSTKVYLYRLGSQGKTLDKVLSVHNNQIEIEALPDVGYVIYKEKSLAAEDMNWSAGSPVKDMGFDSESFVSWNVTGDTGAVSIGKTSYGQNFLSVKGKNTAGVQQQIKNLSPEKEYVASVWADVTGHKEARLSIQTKDENKEASLSDSNVFNYTDNTDRFKTTWQRLKIPFQVPAGENSITLSLTGVAADDTSCVAFDDVRIAECASSQKDGYDYFEDFEHVDEGWGPFIACQPSAFTTHLSEKHDVYTDNTINGNYSLATWRERNGEVYRTSPSMLRFAAGKAYEIEFSYKVDKSGVYKMVGISKSSGEQTFSYDLNRPGRCSIRFVTPECSDFYIVVVKQGDGLLVIDDFGVVSAR